MRESMEGTTRALNDILELPNASRPYEELAKRYAEMGMVSESEAIMFLVGKRFGGKLADSPDSHEEQRKHD